MVKSTNSKYPLLITDKGNGVTEYRIVVNSDIEYPKSFFETIEKIIASLKKLPPEKEREFIQNKLNEMYNSLEKDL